MAGPDTGRLAVGEDSLQKTETNWATETGPSLLTWSGPEVIPSSRTSAGLLADLFKDLNLFFVY